VDITLRRNPTKGGNKMSNDDCYASAKMQGKKLIEEEILFEWIRKYVDVSEPDIQYFFFVSGYSK